MIEIGLVLGPSLMVISIISVLLNFAKYLPFIMYCEVCCCLHIKHLNTCMHIGPSKSRCL